MACMLFFQIIFVLGMNGMGKMCNEKICYIRPAATLKLELDKKVKTILTNYERDLIEAFETSLRGCPDSRL
jgi:hypothetical protein